MAWRSLLVSGALALAAWSASIPALGRPQWTPDRAARAMPAFVLAISCSRSWRAIHPKMLMSNSAIIGEVVSNQLSRRDLTPTPAA